ncbi:hypothetical protein JL721_1468 [Aureococcus anophagefferens]|nr:hypothetical protein JL721_1468 [Aureococcus anophagefferens]
MANEAELDVLEEQLKKYEELMALALAQAPPGVALPAELLAAAPEAGDAASGAPIKERLAKAAEKFERFASLHDEALATTATTKQEAVDLTEDDARRPPPRRRRRRRAAPTRTGTGGSFGFAARRAPAAAGGPGDASPAGVPRALLRKRRGENLAVAFGSWRRTAARRDFDGGLVAGATTLRRSIARWRGASAAAAFGRWRAALDAASTLGAERCGRRGAPSRRGGRGARGPAAPGPAPARLGTLGRACAEIWAERAAAACVAHADGRRSSEADIDNYKQDLQLAFLVANHDDREMHATENSFKYDP